MAGHWIPWETGLERKREVIVIAKTLRVSRLEAAAQCMIVWAWASDQSIDGLVCGLSPQDVSDAVALPGIGEAMAEVGWIVNSSNCVQFPNWGRFNARSAKARLLKSEANRRYYKKGLPTEIQ